MSKIYVIIKIPIKKLTKLNILIILIFFNPEYLKIFISSLLNNFRKKN